MSGLHPCPATIGHLDRSRKGNAVARNLFGSQETSRQFIPTIALHRCDSARSGCAAARSPDAGVGNTPDRAAGIVSDQQRSILGDRKRGRASPYFCAPLTGYPEAGGEILIEAFRSDIF